MVGYNTVNLDNPDLTNREYFIAPFYNFHPVKIIIDKNEKVNKDSKLFSSGENIIITSVQSYKNPSSDTTKILFLENERWNWSNKMDLLWNLGFKSLLIEGGPRLQKSIIKEYLWDEAHILSSNVQLGGGLRAPQVEGKLVESLSLRDNTYRHVLPYK